MNFEFNIFPGSSSMIRLGLCSGACITRDIKGVISAAQTAGLDAIEWAADLHIPAGDPKKAGEAMIATLMAGLTTASFATLYRAGAADDGYERFEALLGTASSLQAPIMRIFTCAENNRGTEKEGLEALASELRRLGDMAAGKGITLCLSMGRGTCLDDYDRAKRLLEETRHDFVRLAWEDLPGSKADKATQALAALGGLAGILVARSAGRDGSARPIAEEEEAWRSRLGAFKLTEADPKMGSFVFLGATREEGEAGEASLKADANTLRALVGEIEPKKKR
jgi:3-dehydroshikimate dehydratase